MTFFQATILGLIEGVTEFLPISSTAHLMLTSKILNLPADEFLKSFEIIIQLGAILAVASIYIKYLLSHLTVIIKLFAAFIPTAVIGLLIYDLVKQVFLESIPLIAFTLFFGGLIMLGFEKYFANRPSRYTLENFPILKSGLVGLFQSISMIPGVSRAAATIYSGMSMGLSRQSAVTFSFLLALPVMSAATLLDLIKTGFNFTPTEYQLLLVGLLSAYVSALVVVNWFKNYIQNRGFQLFAYYRIVLGLLIYFFK